MQQGAKDHIDLRRFWCIRQIQQNQQAHAEGIIGLRGLSNPLNNTTGTHIHINGVHIRPPSEEHGPHGPFSVVPHIQTIPS